MFQISNRSRTVRSRILLTTAIAASYAFSLSSASAAVITGHLGISAGAGGGVTVTNSTIVFGNDLFSVGGTPPNTGYFQTPFDSPSFTGTIKDLNSSIGNQPTASAFSYLNFLTFANNPTTFELTYIDAGTNGSAECGLAAAAGQRCTPLLPSGFGLSPFNLANNSVTQSTASFTVRGLVHNGADLTPFTGTFSTTFNGQSFQDVLAVLAGRGAVSSTWAATFDVAPVPEPASIGLVGLALVGLASFTRRRR